MQIDWDAAKVCMDPNLQYFYLWGGIILVLCVKVYYAPFIPQKVEGFKIFKS